MEKKRRKWRELLDRFVLLRDQSFMSKLFVFSSLLVILPVLAVGIISYQRSAAEIEKEVRLSSLQVIDQAEANIEYYLQDFEITSLKIANSPETANFIQADYTNSGNEEALKSEVRAFLELQEYSRPDISNITIMTNSGKVIDTLGSQNYYPALKMKDEYWYESVPQNGMIRLVSRTLTTRDKQQPVISLVRRLYNSRTLQPAGMLVIDINFRRIEDIANKVTITRNGSFSILDAEGHYVYHPDYSRLGQNADSLLLSKLKLKESDSMVLEGETKDFITHTNSPSLGWTFLTSVQYDNLTMGISQIRKTIFLTIIIALGIAYLAGYGFAAALVRPIKRLQHFMKEVEVGRLDGRVEVESKDEIGQLTIGFNRTVEKLSALLDEVYVSKLNEAELSLKQKESELKMLQAQINPHFLYNSLETIRGMALEGSQEDIAVMSNSLGKLLRYNLKNSSPTVSLQEEIKFCEMYLQIQKFRFGDRFEYQLHIPYWAENARVVKFSLQPIIENCFVHAFGQSTGKLMISISVFQLAPASCVIQIADNGSGIQEEMLNEIERKLKEKSCSSDGKHIGLANVHQRISCLFGEAYSLKVQSQPGCGTQVMMHLPMEMEKREASG
ncbi:cache domain-containing sensor histidine kinase [Domibacillus indicus]|uniref:cache domain-containing sensor histidine kinase n=1 Tax=Domibacillus indicus TaxID=1437523 RepID=UPI000617C338|nr:sensor histidine kinase [Domibacillus indicus]